MIIRNMSQKYSVSDRSDVYSEVAVLLEGSAASRWLVFKIKTHDQFKISGGYISLDDFPTDNDVLAHLRQMLTRPSDTNGWNFVAGYDIIDQFEGEDVNISSELFSHIFTMALAYVNNRYS